MNQKDAKNLLENMLRDLQMACAQLEHSFSLCKSFKDKNKFNQEELDKIEAFTARFARVTDLLIKRGYRTLDVYLLEDGGTLIDVLNRAEKRGLIHSLEEIRILKDIRNLIAHEYVKNDFEEIFKNVVTHTPVLILLVKKLQNYTES